MSSAVALTITDPKPKTKVLTDISLYVGSDEMPPSVVFSINTIPLRYTDHRMFDISSDPRFLMIIDRPKPPEISVRDLSNSLFL